MGWTLPNLFLGGQHYLDPPKMAGSPWMSVLRLALRSSLRGNIRMSSWFPLWPLRDAPRLPQVSSHCKNCVLQQHPWCLHIVLFRMSGFFPDWPGRAHLCKVHWSLGTRFQVLAWQYPGAEFRLDSEDGRVPCYGRVEYVLRPECRAGCRERSSDIGL